MIRALFQSTPPHGGRPEMSLFHSRIRGVSIHAPAWGATEAADVCPQCKGRFQSTPPHGGRLEVEAEKDRTAPVSIHAPACGGDRMWAAKGASFFCFNPRPRMRVRGPKHMRELEALRDVSIHAPACGATGWRCREGDSGSIHAPAWGATAGRTRSRTPTSPLICFNPRPRMRGRGLKREGGLAKVRAASVNRPRMRGRGSKQVGDGGANECTW